MTDSNSPRPNAQQSKSPTTRVLCKLPNEGGTIITTLTNCIDVLDGEVVGKVEDDSVPLVTCQIGGGKSVLTSQSDCTNVLRGTVEDNAG